MKHFRGLLPLLILTLLLSGCGKQNQEPYTASINGRDVNVYPESGQIVDGLNVYTYTVEESAGDTHYTITYPDGSVYHWTETKNGGFGGWSAGTENVRYLSGNTLVGILEINRPRERTGSPVIGLLLMALGAVNFFFPEVMFHLQKGWMFRDAEPSEAYLTWGRICGVIFALLGLLFCFI